MEDLWLSPARHWEFATRLSKCDEFKYVKQLDRGLVEIDGRLIILAHYPNTTDEQMKEGWKIAEQMLIKRGV